MKVTIFPKYSKGKIVYKYSRQLEPYYNVIKTYSDCIGVLTEFSLSLDIWYLKDFRVSENCMDISWQSSPQM